MGVALPVGMYTAAYFIPRKYTSIVTLEVNPAPAAVAGENVTPEESTPYFVEDQRQAIQSMAILYPVIEELGLDTKWSAGLPTKLTKQGAYQFLLSMLHVIRKPNTDFIEIAVTSTDRQEAADIANTIAIIYQKKRRDDQQERITGSLSEMRDEVEKQRAEADKLKADLAKLRENGAIQDPNPETDAPLAVPNPEYEAAKKKYLEAKKLLDDAIQKYQTDKMQLAVEFVPAKIWDRAEPARGASSPNVTALLTVAFAAAFVCVGLGVLLLVIGTAIKRGEPPPVPA
ncbi:MAG TPA: hypothetical protein VG733_11285 [Chthoniobacteraceae bacterium]|nr:hypothetical protein [Chthoniobacteraceae bacterium]